MRACRRSCRAAGTRIFDAASFTPLRRSGCRARLLRPARSTLLVGCAVVRGASLLYAIELNDDSALLQPHCVDLIQFPRTRLRPPAAVAEPGVGGQCIGVAERAICRDPIGFGQNGYLLGRLFDPACGALGCRCAGVTARGSLGAVGSGVIGRSVGTRVGIGWFGGHCGRWEPCRRGCLIDCRNPHIPGITYDGGYAEAMVAPADALALMPDGLPPAEAAPLLRAGVTTYNALRESGACR